MATNKNVKIIIDHTEHTIISALNKKAGYSIDNLSVGDFHVYFGNELILIIERKTISDLSASIKDGRLTSQIFRIKNYCIEHKIPFTSVMILIENDTLSHNTC